MRKTEQSHEPSIEEILASIRKIISDEGEHPSEPAFDPYDSENVKKQADRAQAGGPVGDPDGAGAGADAGAHDRDRDLGPAMAPGPRREDEHGAYAASPADSSDMMYNDEIFELSDDCLLEELEEARAAALKRANAGPGETVDAAAIEKTAASLAASAPEAIDREQAPAGGVNPNIPPLPSEEEFTEINNVLTNVVAEMHRITDVKSIEPSPEFMPGMPEPRSASATSAASQMGKPPVSSKPIGAPAPLARKPAWSARNRGGLAEQRPTHASAAETESAKNAAPTAFSETAGDAPSSTASSASPLMEAIATSLVTALADSNEQHEKSAKAEAAPPPAPAASDANFTQEPPPEEAFAPDLVDKAPESHAAGATLAVAAPVEKASTAPQSADHETPVLPGEDVGYITPPPPPSPDVSEQLGAAPEENKRPAPPVASVAASPAAEPASAAPEATSVRMSAPQASLPTGLSEESVQEMLKPMLAAWLDENLPRLVEKAISDELAKRDLPKTE